MPYFYSHCHKNAVCHTNSSSTTLVYIKHQRHISTLDKQYKQTGTAADVAQKQRVNWDESYVACSNWCRRWTCYDWPVSVIVPCCHHSLHRLPMYTTHHTTATCTGIQVFTGNTSNISIISEIIVPCSLSMSSSSSITFPSSSCSSSSYHHHSLHPACKPVSTASTTNSSQHLSTGKSTIQVDRAQAPAVSLDTRDAFDGTVCTREPPPVSSIRLSTCDIQHMPFLCTISTSFCL